MNQPIDEDAWKQLLSAAYANAYGDEGVHAELSGAVPLGWTYKYADRRFHVRGFYVEQPGLTLVGFVNFIAYGDFCVWRLVRQTGQDFHYEIVTSARNATLAFVIELTLSPTHDVKKTYQAWWLRMNGMKGRPTLWRTRKK